MAKRRPKKEYYTLTWRADGTGLEAMTVPKPVAPEVAFAIARMAEVEDVQLYGAVGSAQVFPDGSLYLRMKGQMGANLKPGTLFDLSSADTAKPAADDPGGLELEPS